jgi:hypothetical protein
MGKLFSHPAVLSCLIGVLLGACASAVPEGSSPAFIVGYVDGCESGYVDAHRRFQYFKDEERFRTDTDYRDGWHYGYKLCYDEASRMGMGGAN